MKKAISFLICALFLVSAVFAAGTSTGGVKTTKDTETKANANPTTGGLAVKPCEDRETAKARIQCRLEQKQTPTPVLEESCRGLANSQTCAQLYQKSEKCYTMKGKEKDSCFRQVIGFSHSTLRNEASKNQENVRNYVVLVLYDLQEKVEEEHAAGKLTDEQAATLIDKIVSTKQTILQGKTKAEIRAALDDLKTTWKSVMTQ